MTKELTKYEPVLVVATVDGQLYFVPAKDKQKILAMIRNEPFIELNGEIISTSNHNIKRIYVDEEGVAGLTLDQRRMLERRKKEFEENLGHAPNKQEVSNIITRMLQTL